MSFRVNAICSGKVAPITRGDTSAIAKTPVTVPVRIERLGIAGDEQAEKNVHGGPEMAVHHYPLDHHDFWREQLGDLALLDKPGAFGSNIAVRGLTENEVRIGDRFALGSAVLEVSQPRQPCWKIEDRFGQKNMVAAIVRTGRCGWYYRVVRSGNAQAGDVLTRVDPAPGAERSEWSVRAVFDILFGKPGGQHADALRRLAALPSLAPKLRRKATERADAA